VLLAGCNSDDISLANNAKANQPVPPRLVAAITEKDMDLQSPILIRLFKQEAELEVWKQDRSGRFALLKTYPICRWSGDLGPKVREGDRQAPEGFYAISPAQMNPQSAYYLSFNTGFPNAFMIKYHMYRNYFPLTALGRYRQALAHASTRTLATFAPVSAP